MNVYRFVMDLRQKGYGFELDPEAILCVKKPSTVDQVPPELAERIIAERRNIIRLLKLEAKLDVTLLAEEAELLRSEAAELRYSLHWRRTYLNVPGSPYTQEVSHPGGESGLWERLRT